LALKVLLENAKLKLEQKPIELDCKLKDELMKVHLSYYEPVSELLEKFELKAMAHITGGGLLENIPRVLPQGCSVELYQEKWKIQPIFELIQKLGNVPEDEMYRTFNMGIGFVLIVDENDSLKILKELKKYNFESHVIGKVVEGERKVKIHQHIKINK